MRVVRNLWNLVNQRGEATVDDNVEDAVESFQANSNRILDIARKDWGDRGFVCGDLVMLPAGGQVAARRLVAAVCPTMSDGEIEAVGPFYHKVVEACARSGLKKIALPCFSTSGHHGFDRAKMAAVATEAVAAALIKYPDVSVEFVCYQSEAECDHESYTAYQEILGMRPPIPGDRMTCVYGDIVNNLSDVVLWPIGPDFQRAGPTDRAIRAALDSEPSLEHFVKLIGDSIVPHAVQEQPQLRDLQSVCIPALALNLLKQEVMDGLHPRAVIKRELREAISSAQARQSPSGFTTVTWAKPAAWNALAHDVIQAPPVDVEYTQRGFDATGEDTWRPDFADKHFGCGWQGGLAGQEELIFEQSDRLKQLRVFFDHSERFQHLTTTREGGYGPGQGLSKVLLLQNLSLDASIDSLKQVHVPGKLADSVYGDYFDGGPGFSQEMRAFESLDEMQAAGAVEVHADPRSMNVFVVTAPSCGGALMGRPIEEEHLRDAFTTAYATFCAIAGTSPKTQTVQIGWWGAGIFQNNPRAMAVQQLTAAQLAGVNVSFHDAPARYYKGHYKAAKDFFDAEIGPRIAEGSTAAALLQLIHSHGQEQGWVHSSQNPVPNAT